MSVVLVRMICRFCRSVVSGYPGGSATCMMCSKRDALEPVQ